MHPIVAGKKRQVIQTIQEETATNIYFPSPLQGVFASDPTGTLGPSTNTIWITGEFFGVQRARDMLFQVSLNKVCNAFTGAWKSPYLHFISVTTRCRKTLQFFRASSIG